MTSISALSQPVSDLGQTETQAVADALNSALADSFALYLKTKNFHWHMQGAHFRDYHLMLDEQADEVMAVTDAIAERVRKIGHSTLRSISDVARHQTIVDNDRDVVAPRDMLLELQADNRLLVESFRAVKAAADQARDNATSGIVDEWTDQAEGRAWFLFESSRSN